MRESKMQKFHKCITYQMRWRRKLIKFISQKMGNEITGQHREVASAIVRNNSQKIQNLLTSTNLQSHLDSRTPSVLTSRPTSRPISPQQQMISSSSKRLVSEPSAKLVSFTHHAFENPHRKNKNNFHPTDITQSPYQSNPVSRIVTVQNERKAKNKHVKFVNYSTEQNKSRVLIQQKDRRIVNVEREVAETSQTLKRQAYRIKFYEQMLAQFKQRDQDKSLKISELEKQSSNQREYIKFLEDHSEEVENDRRIYFQNFQEKSRKVEELVKLESQNKNLQQLVREMEKQIGFKIKLLDQSFLRSSNLREELQNLKSKISQLEYEISCKNEQILTCQETYLSLQQQLKQKLGKLQYTEEQLLHVNRVNEIQARNFQDEITQLRKLIENMESNEKLEKGIEKERTKLFERKIIYDLKKQNIRLWNKLIKQSEKDATQNISQVIKDDDIESFQVFEEENLEKEYLQRYERFMSSLNLKQQQNQSIRLHTSMNQSDIEFYRSKCENLEKMVSSHMTINKEHQQKLEHSLSLSSHSTIQLDHLKYELEASQAHNVLLTSRVQEFIKKEEENKETIQKLEEKIGQIAQYNEIFLVQFRQNQQRMGKIKKGVQQVRQKLGKNPKEQQLREMLNSILIDCGY